MNSENPDLAHQSQRNPIRKDSSDLDNMRSTVSTTPRNPLGKKRVLKELRKNTPEVTDEAAAIDVAMKSEGDYGDSEESGDRWTERPPKSSKKKASKYLLKESRNKKRTKSPTNAIRGGGKDSKKRRFIESAKNRRSVNYNNGDSSDDNFGGAYNYSVSDVGRDTSELRQCFGHECVNPARQLSNYCSDNCGIVLASHRIINILPDRIREWNLTQCAADIQNKKELDKIRAKQDWVKSRLEQLNNDFRTLEVISEFLFMILGDFM